MTPLFDTNTHPLPGIAAGGASFATLVTELRAAGFIGAGAVALPDQPDYSPEAYLAACHAHPMLVPVAAWPDVPADGIAGEIARLQAQGFRAIKIHPRRVALSVRDPRFARILAVAAEAGMVVFHCSYAFARAGSIHPVDPLPWLMDAIAGAPGLKLVLLHGGSVELLRYAEAVRATPGVLIDLSFTITRYAGSSLDLDIACLFRMFDQRMCLGSDFPDYRPAEVRARFEHLAAGLDPVRRDNIGWRNIMTMLGVAPAVPAADLDPTSSRGAVG